MAHDSGLPSIPPTNALAFFRSAALESGQIPKADSNVLY